MCLCSAWLGTCLSDGFRRCKGKAIKWTCAGSLRCRQALRLEGAFFDACVAGAIGFFSAGGLADCGGFSRIYGVSDAVARIHFSIKSSD